MQQLVLSQVPRRPSLSSGQPTPEFPPIMRSLVRWSASGLRAFPRINLKLPRPWLREREGETDSTKRTQARPGCIGARKPGTTASLVELGSHLGQVGSVGGHGAIGHCWGAPAHARKLAARLLQAEPPPGVARVAQNAIPPPFPMIASSILDPSVDFAMQEPLGPVCTLKGCRGTRLVSREVECAKNSNCGLCKPSVRTIWCEAHADGQRCKTQY